MTGQMVKLPEDEDTPEKVSAKHCRYNANPWVGTTLERWKADFRRLPTPDATLVQQRVDKIFRMMDRDKNAQRKFQGQQTLHTAISQDREADCFSPLPFDRDDDAVACPCYTWPCSLQQFPSRNSRREANRILRSYRHSHSTMVSFECKNFSSDVTPTAILWPTQHSV